MSQEEEEVECVDVECCHMCFSTERKLTSLDGVVDIYLLIVGLSPDCEESVKELRSCWECRAVLQRILKFRRQAQWAHDVFVTADALLLDSDMCMSKLKFSGINKINLNHNLILDTVRDVLVDIAPCMPKLKFSGINTINLNHKLILDTVRDVLVDIVPKDTENVNKRPFSDHTKSSSDRNSVHGVFVQQDDDKQHFEANANNMYQAEEKEFIYSMNTPVDADPLAIEIKEEDDIDEGDIFDSEPACDQNQTNIDEQAINNIKTNGTKSNNLISNIKTVEKDDFPEYHSNYFPAKPFITSKVLDNPSDGLTKSKQLVVVIDPLNFSKHDLTPRGKKVTKLNFEDNLDNKVIAIQPPERKANSKNINMVASMKPQVNIHNIPSTSRQPVSIKQLDKIQSNLTTKRNKSPLQEKGQRQVLHHTTTAQHSQIDSTFVKTTPLTERVLSNDVIAQYVKGNLKHPALTPRELKIVKPDENVEPVMNRTLHLNLPEKMKNLHETIRRDATTSTLVKIKVTKVTKSELNDFLEQARNNETYLASPFKCEICILGFKEESFLQRHMIRYRHVTISKNEFVCDVCLSRLPSEQELNTHQSIHDCLYSCAREDFTSVLPLNVYHHCFEKHALNKKCKTSPKRRPQVNQRIKSQAQICQASAGTSAKRREKKKYKRKRKVKQSNRKSKKYEVFKPTIEDFDCMRMQVTFRRGGLQCEDCFQPLYGNEKLEEHRQLCHSENAGAHVCDMCKLRFTTAELLREHKPVHDKWYKCKADPACLYVAQKLNTIQGHITTKHRNKQISRIRPHTHECNICKKVFMSTTNLRRHMLIHNKQHMCEVCGLFGATAYALAKHKRQHTTGERDHLVCEFCPKRFVDKAPLRYHRLRHLQVKSYACKLCDEKFYCPNTRGIHVRKVHENKQKINKIYKCNLCHMEFPNVWTLTTHRSKHKELQRYKCDKCPKTFFMFNHLVSHQESHVRSRVCECDICGKVFANRETLKYHHLNSNHSGGTETQLVKTEKLKECSECGKVFHSVKKWRDHMKTHLIFPVDAPELS